MLSLTKLFLYFIESHVCVLSFFALNVSYFLSELFEDIFFLSFMIELLIGEYHPYIEYLF